MYAVGSVERGRPDYYGGIRAASQAGVRGERADLGDGRWYRSRWEANVARILRHLEAQGEGFVAHRYEPASFVLDDVDGRRACYVPDWRVWPRAPVVVGSRSFRRVYLEVKGSLDDDGAAKMEAFRRTYPDSLLIVIDGDTYHQLADEWSWLPGWEHPGDARSTG